jgi:hypothetical protein
MSIVAKPRPRRNDEPPVVSIGTEHRDRGEPIPPRRPSPFSPSQAEAEATAIAERCAGLPSESLYAFKAGAYESLYGELYQHYLDARSQGVPWMHDDELPELPDSAYFDPSEGDWGGRPEPEPAQTESIA